MRRREFVTLLGGAASWPLLARAQQAAGRRFSQSNLAENYAFNARVRDGMKETGFVDGQNVDHPRTAGPVEIMVASPLWPPNWLNGKSA